MKLLSKIGLISGVMLLAMVPCWADIVSISGTGAGTVQANQSITFTGFTGNPYPASVATAYVVGGGQTLTFGYDGTFDFNISGSNGDRLILVLTNTTGHTLTDLGFSLTGGTFYTQPGPTPPGIPSSGTFASNTYTTVTAYSLTTPTTFTAPITVGNGGQVAFYLAVQDLTSGTAGYDFELSLTPSTVPEPCGMLLFSTGLGLVGIVTRKWRK